MEPLIKITTIPISYELKINEARLERRNGTAELEITRDKGGMQIKSRPIRLRLDTFEARNSVIPTTARATKQFAEKGTQAAYEATAEFAKEGKIMLQTQIGEGGDTLHRIFTERSAMPTGQFQMAFLPSVGPEISWDDPSLSIEYEMDKLNFDLKVDKGDVQFIPGDIELSINQYPDVKIEYIGSPIYVPPSAAALFTGQNVDILA